MAPATILSRVPEATVEWLLGEDNPAVAVLTRLTLLNESASASTEAVWARRNEYPPVAAILNAAREDGSWASPARDYNKYGGNLWQILFLGELWADPDDERLQSGATYAFSRQLADGSWSASNRQPKGSIPCLTANVGRSLARLGFARDERVLSALNYCVQTYRELGIVDCRQARGYQLNGYCHMLTPKILLFLAEVPRELWPDRADSLREACVWALRDKGIFRCLPAESREFQDLLWSLPSEERAGLREHFLAEHGALHYGDKPGWLRFGYPLSYNSDALEALRALAAIGEARRPEYEPALQAVESAANPQMQWLLKNSHNGKMLHDVEAKGQPSRWLTLQGLQVLEHFSS